VLVTETFETWIFWVEMVERVTVVVVAETVVARGSGFHGRLVMSGGNTTKHGWEQVTVCGPSQNVEVRYNVAAEEVVVGKGSDSRSCPASGNPFGTVNGKGNSVPWGMTTGNRRGRPAGKEIP
jgi:hypothetical protein